MGILSYFLAGRFIHPDQTNLSRLKPAKQAEHGNRHTFETAHAAV